MTVTAPTPAPTSAVPSGTAKHDGKATASSFVLPAMFVLAWSFALSGTSAPGGVAHEATDVGYLRWILYFAGFVFVFSSIMHSVFRKSMAASIGWQTNGFELELAAVCLGLGVGCFYAVYGRIDAMVAISFPIISFLFLAGVNHVYEMIKVKNYAPNNTMILIWDFGVPISLVALLISIGKF